MFHFRKHILLGTLTLLLPLATACERVDDMTSPTVSAAETVAPQPNHSASLKGRKVKVAKGSVTISGHAYGYATRKHGVTLTVDGFSLTVPKNAVNERTLFYMTVVPGDEVKVVLKAWAGRNEVHSFHRPLKLTMPLSAVAPSEGDALSKFVLAEIDEDDGDVKDVVNAVVDEKAGTVSGYITHFSIWALAFAKEIIVGID